MVLFDWHLLLFFALRTHRAFASFWVITKFVYLHFIFRFVVSFAEWLVIKNKNPLFRSYTSKSELKLPAQSTFVIKTLAMDTWMQFEAIFYVNRIKLLHVVIQDESRRRVLWWGTFYISYLLSAQRINTNKTFLRILDHPTRTLALRLTLRKMFHCLGTRSRKRFLPNMK